MADYDASQTGSNATDTGPIARPDVDALPAGNFGPASGNTITGAGTLTGASGADTPGAIVEVHGAGGPTSGSNGNFQASGQYGVLSMDAQGNYNYVRNPGTPDGVQDVFGYTLASAQGANANSTLTIDIGQAAVADAGIINLPAGVELSNIHVVGRDLVIDMPDGTHMTIPGGAVFVPQLVIGDVAVPPSNVAALLIDSEPQPAAGPPQSSGGNFAADVPPLDPGVPLGDLIPPTELTYTPPESRPIGQFEDTQPTVVIVTPDNPAGAVDAHDQVDEAGLPARTIGGVGEPEGSNSAANSESTTGTIVFEANDGLDSVTVNGVVITSSSVGQTIQGEFGTLTITSVNLDAGTIGYTYAISDNTDPGGNGHHDDFTVIVTDNDGDTATGTLTVDIIDDVPTARNDTDSVDVQTHIATGNVVTAVGTTNSGADTVGADDAHITGLSSNNVSGHVDNDAAGGFVVDGQFGTLTMNADGSYSYVLHADAPGGSTDVFTYTLTDGDGDPSTATLTITNPDNPVQITNLTPQANGGDVIVDEDDLQDGSDTTKESTTVTGTFNISAPDGVASLTVGGVAVVVNGVFQVGAHIDTPLGNTLTFTGYNAATGQITYTYTLLDNEQHASGGGQNSLFENFTVVLTDTDGDTDTDTLSVNIVDDVPTAANDTDALIGDSLTTDGNVITTVGTTDAPGTGVDVKGADGAAITAIQGAGGTDTSFTNGLLEVQGAHGTLTIDANGNYTYTRAEGDVQAGTDTFTYTLTDGDGDPSTATLTIDLPNINRAPDARGDSINVSEEGLTGGQPDGNGTPDTTNLAIRSGSITISDPDGDALTVTMSAPSGSYTSGGAAVNWYVSPDGQTLIGYTGGDHTTNHVVEVTIDNTGAYTVTLVQPFDDPDATIEDSINFTIPVNVSDGQLSTPTTIVVTVEDDSPIATNDTGHAVEGTTLTVTTSVLANDHFGGDGPLGGTESVTSVTHGLNTVTPNGSGDIVIAGTYGTLTMHSDGTYTYLATQGSIPPAGAQETFTYLITDGDNDTATATLTIDVDNNNLTPVAGTVNAFVDDEGLAGGILGNGSSSGDINANAGEVGSGTSSEAIWTGTLAGSGGDAPLSFSFAQSLDGTAVSGGVGTEAATWNVSADGLTLEAVGPRGVIFTVTITDASTGAYTLTLNDNVLNTYGDNTEASATVNIPYTLTDVDSSVTGTIHATFNDDTPTATNDGSNAVEGTTLTVNTSVLANDNFGADGPLGGTQSVTSVTHGATTVTPNGSGDMVIAGSNGTLTMHSDGTYTYLANDGSVPPAGATETFTYLITDADGDTAQATLTINVANDNLTPIAGTVNAFVDDEGLAGGILGNGSSSGDINANAGEVGSGTSSEAIWTGTLQGSGGDAPINFAFSQSLDGTAVSGGVGTEAATWNVSADGLTLEAIGPRGVIFTVHITNAATGAYTLTLNDNVLNTYGDNTEASATVNIPYTVNDVDSSVTGTIHATFNDDTPTATNDGSNAVEGTTLTVNTSVLANDNFGADGPLGGTQSVTSVTHGATTTTPNGSGDIVIAGSNGTLTMHSDGTYTYLANQGSVPPAGATETFTYTITDGDGDTATATLTINVANNNLTPSAGTVNAFVDDEGLAGGIAGGTGDINANLNEVGSGTSSEAIWTGTLQGSGGDAPIGFSFAQSLDGTAVSGGVGQEAATWNVSADGLTLEAIGPRGVIFTVTITNASTGAYTLTLNDNVLNTQGDNTEASAFVNIPYTVTDVDNSTATGTIHAEFNDDTPTAVHAGAITTGLSNGGGDSATANLDSGVGGNSIVSDNMGADGGKVIFTAATITALQGQDLAHGGVALEYTITGNGQLLTGYVDTNNNNTVDGGETVFTIQLQPGGQPNDYVVTMVQSIDTVQNIDFNGGGYNFVGGNGSWAGFTSGTNGDGILDLLLTPEVNGVKGGTMNTNANEGGVSSGNSVAVGEGVRVDAVQDLQAVPAPTPSGDYALLANQNHVFGQHENVLGVSGVISTVNGPPGSTTDIQLVASDEAGASDTNDLVGDGAIEAIDTVVISHGGFTVTVLKSVGVHQVVSVDGHNYTVDFGATDATVSGVIEGTRLGATTADGFDSLLITNVGGADFKIGDFNTLSVASGPLDVTVPISVVDGDGDTVSSGNLAIHIDGSTGNSAAVVNTLMATNSLSTQSLNTTSLVGTNDNNHRSSEHRSEDHRAFNSAALLGAVAAAGLSSAHELAAETTHGHASLRGVHSGPIMAPGALETAQSVANDSSASHAGGQQGHVTAADHQMATSHLSASSDAGSSHGLSGHQQAPHMNGTAILSGSEADNASGHFHSPMTSHGISIPSAQMLAAHVNGSGGKGGVDANAPDAGAQSNAVVGQVLADSLAGGHTKGPNLDALLQNATEGHGHGGAHSAALAALASHAAENVSNVHSGHFVGFAMSHGAPIMEQVMMHQDAAPAHS